MKPSHLLFSTLLGGAAAFAWSLRQAPAPTTAAPVPPAESGETRGTLREKLKEAAARRVDAEQALKNFAEQFWKTGRGAPLTRDLESVQGRLDRLSKLYTARHPFVAALRAQARKIEERRDSLLEEDPDYQHLAGELRRRQDENERLWHLYDAAKADGIPEKTNIPPPGLPGPSEKASWPGGARAPLLGAGAGLLLSLLAGAAFEKSGGPSGELEKAEWSAGLPVLAVVPRATARKRSFLRRAHPLDEARRRLILLHPPNSPLAEAHRALFAALRLSARTGGHPAPAVGFTSPGASQRKTAAALNFALTTSRAGLKTLFIEADLRRPSAHALLGLPREPGLSDAALGRKPWTSAVRGTSDLLFARVGLDALLKTAGIENFNFMSCGAPAFPADVFGAPQLEAILKEMRGRHDILVFDVPSILDSADAFALAPRLEAVVLVHERGSSLEGLKRAKERLLNVKIPVSGLLLVQG